MRRSFAFLVLIVVSVAAATAQHATINTPGNIKWGAAPPALPKGAQFAVLDGDPSKPGMFTIRLKFPDGYRVAPHWHPTDEHVIVLQGVFRLGNGEKATDGAYRDMEAGSYVNLHAKSPHFVAAKGETIVQVYGQGPFVLNYVNPADDPQKKTQD